MSKLLNNVLVKIEASKIRLAKAQQRRNQLPNMDDMSNVSSTTIDVEEIYGDVATTVTTTPSKTNRPKEVLAFCNEGQYWATPPKGRSCLCPFSFCSSCEAT